MSNLFEHCRAGVSSASAKDTIKPSAEASASLIMPRRSIYDEVKDTIKPNAMQIYLLFAEAKYPPGVSQRYEPAAASPAARFQKERNEGLFMVRS